MHRGNKMNKNINPLKIATAVIIALIVGVFLGTQYQKVSEANNFSKHNHGELNTIYTCPMHPQIIQNEPGQCPICGMNLVPSSTNSESGNSTKREITHYAAPMDPTFISDKPGKSPMGMDLVPVYADETPSSGTGISIDPAVVQKIGVRSVPAELIKLRKSIKAVGSVTIDEEKTASINLKTSGWIEELYLDKTGQEVKKGAPLFTLYSPELISAQEEYLLAIRYFDEVSGSPFEEVTSSARSLINASRRRLINLDMSSTQIKRLAREGRPSRTVTFYSPVEGVVLHKKALKGLKVSPGQDLYKISDLKSVWISVKFFEQDSPWVSEGDPAKITIDNLPGKKFDGTVSYIYPYLDSKTFDFTARIKIKNENLSLKPGMFATVNIIHENPKASVVIPDEAVIRSGERNIVFIDLKNGHFEPRTVELGLFGDDRMVEILSGVQASEMVVTSAHFLLDSESSLQESIKKMMSPKEVPDDIGPGTIYVCPMEIDKDIVSDHPGPCPKCGMDLVPLDEINYDHPILHRH